MGGEVLRAEVDLPALPPKGSLITHRISAKEALVLEVKEHLFYTDGTTTAVNCHCCGTVEED